MKIRDKMGLKLGYEVHTGESEAGRKALKNTA